MAAEKDTLTQKNNVAVYKETTIPANKHQRTKKKRRDRSDLGPDFVAPDGGWGWVVCLAAGCSNLSIFPGLQQYGLIYRQRLTSLGFDAKQTTTIVNIVMAISSLVGIVNGAMFRRFTFRQVAITGSLLVFAGIFLSAFCTTFVQYIICLSCIYGLGLGLNMAATSLAVNTYFKNRRRRATGFSWTITGLGPIFFPHVSTFLMTYYGMQGSILIYSGIGLNSLLCACTLQPVLWHVRKPEKPNAEGDNAKLANGTGSSTVKDPLDDYECKYCKFEKHQKRNIFSSQYLFNDDDPERPGYEITEPGTPMLARANDGWFGSKMSLTSEKGTRYRHNLVRNASIKSRDDVERQQRPDGGDIEQSDRSMNYFNRERTDRDRYASKMSVYSIPEENRCTCVEEKALMQKVSEEELRQEEERLKAEQEAAEALMQKMTLKQKIVKFFDLDLLKDLTFVNLALGMTVMMFGEMNFSVLTPFILNSFGYTDRQISLAMSLLGAMDISVRFVAPIVLEKVKLANRVLFAFGIMAITLGRFIVTLTDSYNVILAVFVLIGFGKGFRTIFSPLIIPSYVPLNRLPAASGLQLIFNTLFSIAFGPILGIITDATSYKVTIHFINILTSCALLLWLSENLIRRWLCKPAKPTVT